MMISRKGMLELMRSFMPTRNLKHQTIFQHFGNQSPRYFNLIQNHKSSKTSSSQILSPNNYLKSPILCSASTALGSRVSQSHCHMDSICWVETSDDEKLCDAAEEALAEHYYDQVTQFYIDERERVRGERGKER